MWPSRCGYQIPEHGCFVFFPERASISHDKQPEWQEGTAQEPHRDVFCRLNPKTVSERPWVVVVAVVVVRRKASFCKEAASHVTFIRQAPKLEASALRVGRLHACGRRSQDRQESPALGKVCPVSRRSPSQSGRSQCGGSEGESRDGYQQGISEPTR